MPYSETHRTTLPPEPDRVADARRFVVDIVGGRVPDSALEIVRLLTSEIFTNGIQHGTGGPIEVEVHVDGDVKVRITDTGPGFAPTPRERDVTDPGGYGLVIVDRLADEWGVDATNGTSVWFRLQTPVTHPDD